MAESRYRQDGDFSQAKQRRGQMFRDQHGRRYYASIELRTGDPCGLIEPQFSAPLAVPQMYLERSSDPERPYDIQVSYTRWKADIRAARSEWEREGRQLARKMHGDRFDPRADFPRDVLDIIGEPPQHVEPVIAAEQGNSWVLGLTDRVDLRLAAFFTPKELDPSAANEPDFRDVADDFEAIEQETDRLKAQPRRKHRARKQPDEPTGELEPVA